MRQFEQARKRSASSRSCSSWTNIWFKRQWALIGRIRSVTLWTFGHEGQVASYFLGPQTSCAFRTYAALVVSLIMSSASPNFWWSSCWVLNQDMRYPFVVRWRCIICVYAGPVIANSLTPDHHLSAVPTNWNINVRKVLNTLHPSLFLLFFHI